MRRNGNGETGARPSFAELAGDGAWSGLACSERRVREPAVRGRGATARKR
jgi:hypothetical protein